MTVHSRKLKTITFTLAGASFECQVKSWNIANNTGDGERMYGFCPDGEFIEDAEPEYALELEFFADWRGDGISDYLTSNDQETVAFQLDHHPDDAGEHVRWVGDCKIKAPSVGGDARKTEMTSAKFQCIGKPAYSRP